MAPANQLPLKRVPVTVVGGYLGAGKTTLINRLLADDHGLRIAVLVNDFGKINVDADLSANHDGQTLALTNGCVCCLGNVAVVITFATERSMSWTAQILGWRGGKMSFAWRNKILAWR